MKVVREVVGHGVRMDSGTVLGAVTVREINVAVAKSPNTVFRPEAHSVKRCRSANVVHIYSIKLSKMLTIAVDKQILFLLF